MAWQEPDTICRQVGVDFAKETKANRIRERGDVDMGDSVAILKKIVDANEVDAEFQATYGIRGII